jgi:hypothetical protein
MELTCYRNTEIARAKNVLPVATDNFALTLLSRTHFDPLFIPIRAMQYIAIFDAEELVLSMESVSAGSILPGKISGLSYIHH